MTLRLYPRTSSEWVDFTFFPCKAFVCIVGLVLSIVDLFDLRVRLFKFSLGLGDPIRSVYLDYAQAIQQLYVACIALLLLRALCTFRCPVAGDSWRVYALYVAFGCVVWLFLLEPEARTPWTKVG